MLPLNWYNKHARKTHSYKSPAPAKASPALGCWLPQPFDWQQHIEQLRHSAPEKKIMVEADNMSEAELAIKAKPDIIQLDKFSPQQILEALNLAAQQGFRGQLIAAGGIKLSNIQDYAATGVPVLVTSSPYYAKPADIKVTLKPN
ncbi:hypothetical protein [Oligella urethralis]|uniref:hypothetical protein n=1 Tax=Oligella urethralis TaxID=90245 RepID=UPI0009D9F9E1|nr:hypothetical protein [Oligella urethralis]